MFISSLFHSLISFGKNEFWKKKLSSSSAGDLSNGICLGVACKLRYNRVEISKWSVNR